ncbi:MAG: choice-of-anchor J domain-containing protein, partial [Muribaculaceae bacterium]|nr:choice-of-anchor J domain-containing protein [Muribaculaceae bacterium]
FTQGSRIISINGQGGAVTPVDESVFLSAKNDKGAEGWTLTGTDKWEWQSYNGNYYLNISCQNDPQTDNLYAISPVIDLAAKGYKSMSFMHAAKFQDGGFKEKCQIAIREEGAKEWTVLKFTGYPGTENWTFVNSGDIDISAYAGKKVEVAFIYGAGCTDKWEINDLTFAK